MIARLLASVAALTGAAYAEGNTPLPASEAASTPVASAGDRLTYEPGFFAAFNPQNALDMVRQTPGFSLDGGDSRRGFSGAVGNVLIDGARPIAKAQTLDGILSRIPANQVVRIELLRGSLVAGDASGQSVLLNVVRTPTAGSGVWEVGFEYSGQNDNNLTPRYDISYSGRSGQIEWGLGSRLFSQDRAVLGDRSFYDGVGTYVGRAINFNPRTMFDPYLNGNIAFPLWNGRFSATGQTNPDWFFKTHGDFDFRDAADARIGQLLSISREEGTVNEVGLNYDRDIGPWSLALVSLINRNHFERHDRAGNLNAAGATLLTTAQDIERDAGETILRGTLSRELTAQHRLEIGGEGALNTLDSALQLTVDGGAGPQALVIPNSNVTVEEERAEFFAAHTWRPNPLWSVESRLAWETSTLTFTGDANQSTELTFWKPSLQITRTFSGDNQLRARVYRDVGQLDFDDFVSAAGITDNIINGGNPDLEPQSDWRAEIGGDLRFPGGGALGFALTHHQITNVNDVVLIVAPNPGQDPLDPNDDFIRFDAPGNIGDAEAMSLELNASLPLRPLIPGARLTVDATFWDTEVTDPVTNRPRIISNQPESELNVSFRQDFPEQRWAWGFEAHKQGEGQAYRFNEIDTQEEGPWVDLWWETTNLPHHMKLRVTLPNIANGTIERDRRFYTTDRGGVFSSEQITNRQFQTSPWVLFQLSGSF